jgi:hypothetical protein
LVACNDGDGLILMCIISREGWTNYPAETVRYSILALLIITREGIKALAEDG